MNRRLILIDEEQANPLQFYGVGLGGEIYTMATLNGLPTDEQDRILSVGEGDGVLVVGKEAYNILKPRYHFGIRNENIYDVSLLNRLSISGGAFIKVLHKTGSDEMRKMNPIEISYFMSEEFTRKRDFSYFKQLIIHTYKDAIPFLDYFYNSNEDLGFDYETNGMPDHLKFNITGASLCDKLYGAFFSWTDIKRNSTEEEFKDFERRFSEILVKNQSRIWAYNLQFEQLVSFREFGVDLELCDAGVYNILDAFHGKKYSLKWTGQRVLMVNAWDTDFDYLNDKLDEMYFEKIVDPTNKRNTIKSFKCDVTNFDQTPEFQEVIARYPKYVDEFKRLITENFGNTFNNIPSDILGYYCNLDSFYTLMIHLESKSKYSEGCIQTYLDNMRLGARLHSGGMYKDEKYRLEYETECYKMMCYGITYSATVHCKVKMDYHKKKSNDISLYNDSCINLLNRGEFMKGDVALISKKLIVNNLSDCYDSGLDEGMILINYGEDILEALTSGLAATNTKADSGISRKRKPFVPIIENITKVLQLDSIPMGVGHDELELYLFFKSAYDSFLDIWKNQMKDIYHVPETFKFLGMNLSQEEYHEYIKENYFNCTSPKDYPEIINFFINMYKYETVFLTTIYQNKNKLQDQEKFYINQGIDTIDKAYSHFMNNINLYPSDIKKEAAMYMNDLTNENMMTTFTSFNGFWKQADFIPSIREDYDSVTLPYTEDDFNNSFLFMRKFCILSQLYKKYIKVLSTYVGGLFISNDRQVIDTDKLIPLRKADINEPGQVTKMFPRFAVCEKSTKRWSSPYHTIIAHSDIKRIVSTPKGYLLSYFDISSAEVRTLMYRSGDPKGIELFETKQDLYVHTAKIAFPDGDWNDPFFKNNKRRTFKQILLGKMYGMGDGTLSVNAMITVEEAQRLSGILFDEFKVVKQYIDDNMQYPLNHNGNLRTILGDTLKSDAWRYIFRPDGRMDTNNKSRVMRHGINYVVQGSSACILARGFWNNIRVAKKEGFVLQPIIVVHDSNTNYFPVDKLWDIKAFYDKNFTDFCREACGVPFLFDLLIGTNYEDAVGFNQIDLKTISMSGNGKSVNQILDKLDYESNIKYRLVSIKDKKSGIDLNPIRESIQLKPVSNPIERFIRENGTNLFMDLSKYEVVLEKLN